MGDLNDSVHARSGFMYISDYMGTAGYVHLASDLADYPDTRVNGSKIDDILVLMQHRPIQP